MIKTASIICNYRVWSLVVAKFASLAAVQGNGKTHREDYRV